MRRLAFIKNQYRFVFFVVLALLSNGIGLVWAVPITMHWGLIQTAADAYIYDLGIGNFDERKLSIDTFSIPTEETSRTFDFTGEISKRGFNLKSSATSYFLSTPSQILASGHGSCFSDIVNGEAGFYGTTGSFYITNLRFFVDIPHFVNWQYEAYGVPGPLGTSNGIDMRIKIIEYSNATFSTQVRTVTQQYLGAGSASESFELTPGFYNLITQGRVLFNQPNESNRDGSSTWSYQYSVTPIPEPSTIVLISCGLLGLLGICVKRRRKEK